MFVVVSSQFLGGFGAVLLFPPFFLYTQNSSKTTQEPRRDHNKQLKYDLTVLFSSIFIFNF